MVCYKLVPDTSMRAGRSTSVTPKRSRCSLTPPRNSPPKPMPPKPMPADVPSKISELVNMLDYEPYNIGVLDAVPQVEWRLLGALIRKREEEEDRFLLADQLHKTWEREKRKREMEEARSAKFYRHHIHSKRQKEREWSDFRKLERDAEQHVKRTHLVKSIRHKDKKSAELLASEQDKKTTELADKAVEDQLRRLLAEDRRSQYHSAQEWRNRLDMVDKMRRVDDARQRRRELLRDTAQRTAISNALSMWESAIAQQEVAALECARRAQHASHAASTRARANRAAQAREQREARARTVAALCAQLRDAVICSREADRGAALRPIFQLSKAT